MAVDWAAIESELEAAAWSVLDGPADAAAAKSVRRVVEARTRRWFGRIPGLKSVDVQATAVAGGIAVEVTLHLATTVRRIRSVVGGV
jgi:phage baseplate assembly protein W